MAKIPASIGIYEAPIMSPLKQLLSWFKSLSEGWKRTLFSAFVAATIAVAALVISPLINMVIDVLRPIVSKGVQPEPTATAMLQSSEELAFAAERVRACMEAHGLPRQKVVMVENLFMPESTLDWKPGDLVDRTTIEYCEWPPSSYSEADGYVQLVSEAVVGPGLAEATGATYADRIFSQCQTLSLSYGFGKQGVSGNSSFEVIAGSIIDGNGNPWDPDVIDENPDHYRLPFLGIYTRKGEVVVIRNAGLYLEDAECTS